jgi:hypothetical protein
MNVTPANLTAGTYSAPALARASEANEARGVRDNDGDNDGGAARTQAPQPQVSRPTATMGNNVNTVA